ncbi:MAG: hypothetical protein ACK5JS_05490 [Mangrovibacterium sp.]
MKILVYTLIAISFMSCEKGQQENFPGSKGLYLVLVNTNGENLLNPKTENSIDFNKVKRFCLIDGEYIEQYHGHLDHPKGCGIFDSEYAIGNIFATDLSGDINENSTSTTVIDWGNGDSDTIVATMNPDTNFPYSEFWYNGISMKDFNEKLYGDENYYFEISKDY